MEADFIHHIQDFVNPETNIVDTSRVIIISELGEFKVACNQYKDKLEQQKRTNEANLLQQRKKKYGF